LTGIGIIGIGYWGPNLVRNFKSVSTCKVVGIHDLRPDRVKFIQNSYPDLRSFESDQKLIDDPAIEAVAIATPVAMHYPVAKAALTAGKHVLLEKPLTSSVAQAAELVELAAKKGLTLMVDHTFLYTGAVRKIKELVDSGELGNLLYFDSVRVNLGLFQHDINVIADLTPHDISICDYISGKKALSVNAVGHAFYGQTIENVGYLAVKYEDDLLAHFHVNWLAPVKVRTTLIGGTEKMIVYDDMEPSEKIKIYDKKVVVTGPTGQEDKESVYRALVEYRTGDMRAPKLESTEALKLVAKEFIDSITQKRKPLSSGEDGLHVVRILEAADRSLKQSGAQIIL
jgi:predicted dehydrogenase